MIPKKNGSKGIVLLFLLIVLMAHTPFLAADPDIHLSGSRDAFTDEGLNTSQLRNYINHGYLDFWESDNLVKTPLFNLLLFLPLQLFGTKIIIARLTILLLIFSILLLLSTHLYFRQLVPFLCLTTLIQYHVFQYSHYSLSEMLSVSLIAAGLIYLIHFISNSMQNHLTLFIATLLLALAFFVKIQFIYIIPLIPATVILCRIIFGQKTIAPFFGYSPVFFSILLIIVFLSFYLLTWYFPHREIFNYVLQEEAAGKYASLENSIRTFAFNTVCVLFSSSTWMINSLFICCFLTGCLLWKLGAGFQFKVAFAVSTCWLILELHKLTMIYLPSRYLVSYYFSGGLLSSIVLAELMYNVLYKTAWKISGILLLFAFILVNGFDYAAMYASRAFKTKEINVYFAHTLADKKDALVLGPWAPAFTWDSKVISRPVWYHFMNDEHVLQQHPAAILSEPDEEESNQAYQQHDLRLDEHADSVKHFTIGRWEVIIYWIAAQR